MQEQEGNKASPAGVPTCYRHPQRETYLRCSRCDQPICPDCMVAAPVGFHCRDCVRQAQRESPQVRTSLGARPGTKPILTYSLITVMVVVFLVSQAQESLQFEWMLQPVMVAVGDQFYRLFTATLLHASLMHLAFNMLALWMFGSVVETLLGHRRFALLYGLCALGGSTLSYMFTPLDGGSVGASGAIFGLFGAMFILNRRVDVSSAGLWVVLVINLVMGFTWSGIDWRAHLGGLFTGVVVAMIMTSKALQPSTGDHPIAAGSRARHRLLGWKQWVGLAAVLVVLLAGVGIRTAAIRTPPATLGSEKLSTLWTTHGENYIGVSNSQ